MRVKNWTEFQHFKDRTPPWIKLHRTILERRDINLISDCSFRILVGIWLLASEDKDMEGNLPEIPEIAFRLRIEESKIINALQELTPFVEGVDIELISERYQHDVPETEEETEAEERHKQIPAVDKSTTGVAKKISLDWTPNRLSVQMIEEYRVTLEQAKPAIDDFMRWAIESGKKQKNWDLAFQRNPVVKSNLAKISRGQGNGSHQQDTRSRAKRVSDKLDEIARQDIEQNGFTEFVG